MVPGTPQGESAVKINLPALLKTIIFAQNYIKTLYQNMALFITSSIGKKLIMSISGFFLMVFLLVHLAANLASLFGKEAYNAVCHFMDTNIFIQVMVPVLAAGFIVHILYGLYLTLANRLARGSERYAVANSGKASTWASRNMFVLGAVVLGFLGLHLTHFWAKMQLQHFLGQEGEDAYLLVTTLFGNPLYVALYLIWIGALWLHLSHGFWSAFQTAGVNNSKWLPRLQFLAKAYATAIAVGFSIIPLWFLIHKYFIA
jgi:succinate dehydrogenase / fumarate reductase cytochrome b subunit